MSPGTTQNDMITKAEIMEKAALKIDLSEFPAESLEKLNEMFNGDYAGAMAKTDAEIEKGVDLYLSAVGRSVEVWHKGKSHTTKVARIDYDTKDDYFVLEFSDRGSSVFAMAALHRWDIRGNFTGYSTPPLENVELNFCKTKPGAQSPGIII